MPASGGVISAAKPQMDREPLQSPVAFPLECLRTALAHPRLVLTTSGSQANAYQTIPSGSS